MTVTELGPTNIFHTDYCLFPYLMLKIDSALFVVCLLAIPSLSQAAMEAGTIKSLPGIR